MQLVHQANLFFAIKIMHESFHLEQNQLSAESVRYDQALYHLCKYCVETARWRKGALITNDLEGVMLLYETAQSEIATRDFFPAAELIKNGNGLLKAIDLMKHQQVVSEMRKKGRHLYLQLMAVSRRRNGLKTVLEMKEEAFRRSKIMQLPLLTETSVLKNKKVYERLGFTTYNQLEMESGITVWFMERPPDPLN